MASKLDTLRFVLVESEHGFVFSSSDSTFNDCLSGWDDAKIASSICKSNFRH